MKIDFWVNFYLKITASVNLMFKYSLSAIAGAVLVGVCSTTAKAFSNIPDIKLGGITYEIDFKSSFFNTSNLDPDLQALLEAQPWFTGTFSGDSLALDAASQIYDCGGFIESSCSIPFDKFGSVNPYRRWNVTLLYL
ncbi:hypothetical protein [Microseira sp. BLCC-F43]|jgi:hypothetical protein|uniref:hypothetical protein n=1 Tax=Microseira sp. BLCC-F43 TaxID=3153602 RepID=UPI0035B888C4